MNIQNHMLNLYPICDDHGQPKYSIPSIIIKYLFTITAKYGGHIGNELQTLLHGHKTWT